jgi:Cytosol aminopeptidase family, N-terminal domain
MSLSAVEPSLEAVDALDGVDALCLVIAQDDRPLQGAAGFVDWRLCGGLSKLLVEAFFEGKPREQVLFPAVGLLKVSRVFAVGAGPSGALDAAGLGAALEHAAHTLARAGVSSTALVLPLCPKVDDVARAEAIKQRFVRPFGPGPLVVFADRNLKAALGA